MSELSEIQYKVNEQRRLNNELKNELSTIVNGVQNAYNKWNNLCSNISNSLNAGAQRVNASQGSINAAYEMQAEIDNMYILFKNIELANKKIRECNNKKIYDFANYSAVRKIVSAILDNVEKSFVSDAVITKSVEVKHLQVPDYWLTCALLSIMAWRNDNKKLAEQALEKACQLDKKETAVFFLAFNLRMGRESAAIKWFEYYQSCDLSGEDDKTFLLLFSIVNKVINENCSDVLVSKVNDFIKKVISDDMTNSGYNEEEVLSRISMYLRRFIPNESIGYSVLLKYCKERDYLQSEMMLAKANINILDFILKTVNVSDEEKKNYLNSFIENVVKKPNSVELEVNDEIEYNELIIKYQGNIDRAKEEFDSIKSHRENEFDIVIEMIDWIYKSEQKEEVNPMVKANMLSISKDLNMKSVERHFDNYRKSFKTNYAIQIEGYETTANLTDESGECAKIKTYMSEQKNAALSSVKTWIAFIGFGVALLSIIGAFAVAVPLLAFTVIGIAFGVIYLLVCKSKKASIIRDYDNKASVYEGIMKNMISEFDSYSKKYKEYDSYSEKIIEEFDKM